MPLSLQMALTCHTPVLAVSYTEIKPRTFGLGTSKPTAYIGSAVDVCCSALVIVHCPD